MEIISKIYLLLCFDSDINVIRQEMTVFFSIFAYNLGVELPKVTEAIDFLDSNSIESWGIKQVSQLQQARIINCKLNNLFDPTGMGVPNCH